MPWLLDEREVRELLKSKSLPLDKTVYLGEDPRKTVWNFIQGAEVDERGCWIWSRGLTHWGYGQVNVAGEVHRTSRLSYQIFVGKIPSGLYVCHSCDVRKCNNPQHLWIGTHADNMRDAKDKFRFPHIEDEFTRIDGLSTKERYKLRVLAMGLCIKCRQPRGEDGTKNHCRKHANEASLKVKLRNHTNPEPNRKRAREWALKKKLTASSQLSTDQTCLSDQCVESLLNSL